MSAAPLPLAAWRAACDLATEGPWTADEIIHDNELIANVVRTRNGFLPSVQQGDYATIDYEPHDATFIALARSALPAAIEEIERLRGRVALLEESLDDTCEQCDGACPHRKEQP